ncbi:MAG: GGDEF domain-containing response regulator [Deltaproteobacteria bacterium]|nr:GGDEF domain-containing response regulator [Deltaproteobacteria bacterium]
MGDNRATIRVLQVEDDALQHDLVQALLRHAQHARFDFEHVDRLEDALRRLTDRAFDVVLLDFSLPDGVGLEILDAVLPAAKDAAIVIHTGSDDQALGLAALNRGAQDYLVKSITDGRAMERAILYAIERKRAQAMLRRTETDLASLALIDELTGLNNRRGLFLLGEQTLKLAARNRSAAAVVFADVDGLKEINDRAGHAEGDRALVDFAGILRATFRDSDVLGRLGGDEFVAIVGGGDGAVLPERLFANLVKSREPSESSYRLSVSVGLAVFDPEHPLTLAELITHADEEMYLRKRQAGRAQWQR